MDAGLLKFVRHQMRKKLFGGIPKLYAYAAAFGSKVGNESHRPIFGNIPARFVIAPVLRQRCQVQDIRLWFIHIFYILIHTLFAFFENFRQGRQ